MDLVQNMGSPCMNKNTQKCSKNFPKNFNNKTSLNSSGYPLYIRRNDGKKIIRVTILIKLLIIDL